MAKAQPVKTVKVVVLGDIGRSPRMQYHALSLANNGCKVDIVSYMDTLPLKEVLNNPNITIHKLCPMKLERAPKLIKYFAKTIWQTISLLCTLFLSGKCDYLLCQNPPAIPTLPVCRFYCLVSKTKFIIDFHNYAYSIMALSLSSKHPLVRIARWIEKYFAQSSNNNMCVTYAMKADLIQNWNVESTVLHDKPPKIFSPLTLQEKHDWFHKMALQYPEFKPSGRQLLNEPPGDTVKTVFTEVRGDKVFLREDRPGLLFSSTSWTPDEDFSILMEAFQSKWNGQTAYEITYELTKKLPKLICVITGKGPMKEHYISEIARRKWQHVKVVTPWLEASDYPKMVASADLGVCLHTSSSGLDLPMKVVDMFGAELPVLACHFKCIDELVQDGVNGYTFKDTDELAKQLVTWFEEFPKNDAQNRIADWMRQELKKFQKSRWEDNWNLRAKKLFQL